MTGQATKEPWVVLGRVSGVYGVKGWIKVFSHTEPPDNILEYSPWYLRRDGRQQAFDVLQGKVHGKGIIAQLANCPDRDVAAGLSGSEIVIERDRMPELAEDEFYWADLIGLQVQDINGQVLGDVEQLLATGANDVLVVKGQANSELLIPYILDEVVLAIDLEAGVMQVDWDTDY